MTQFGFSSVSEIFFGLRPRDAWRFCNRSSPVNNDPKIVENKFFDHFTPTLSEFYILNDVTLIIHNWLVSRLFSNISHRLDFAEKYKIYDNFLNFWYQL